MGNRLGLHSILKDITPNVYYQSPGNVLMTYPAILYSRRSIKSQFADNLKHVMTNSYTITVMDRSPDSKLIEKIMALPFTSHAQSYVADGLYHEVFIIYY